MVAPVASQLVVLGIQSIHWQGHANAGQLPFLVFLSLCQMMKVPNEPGLSPNNGLEDVFPRSYLHLNQNLVRCIGISLAFTPRTALFQL